MNTLGMYCFPLIAALPLSGPPERLWQEFVAFAERHVPKHGTIETVYKGGHVDVGLNLGYDCDTRAYYKVNNGHVIGRSARGFSFIGEAKKDGVGPDTNVLSPEWDQAPLDFEMPFLYIQGIIKRYEAVDELVALEGGGYRLTATFPFGDRGIDVAKWPSPDTIQYRKNIVEIDGACRITRFKVDPGVERTFEYSEQSPPLMPVPKVVGTDNGWVLESIRFTPGSNPAAFEPAAVERAAIAADTAAKPIYQRVTKDTPIPDTVPDAMKLFVKKSHWYSTNWPIGLVGVLLLVVGGYVAWKRRG